MGDGLRGKDLFSSSASHCQHSESEPLVNDNIQILQDAGSQNCDFTNGDDLITFQLYLKNIYVHPRSSLLYFRIEVSILSTAQACSVISLIRKKKPITPRQVKTKRHYKNYLYQTINLQVKTC